MLSGLLTCVLLSSAAVPARMAMVPVVVAKDGLAVDSTLATTVREAIEHRPTLDPISEEELFSLAMEDARTPIVRCGSDPACATEILAGLDATLGLIVLVNRRATPALYSVRILDVAERRVVFERNGPFEPGGLGAICTIVEQALDGLGHPRRGVLSLTVEPSDARVWVDDEPHEGTGDLSLSLGPHVVRAEREGHESMIETVDIKVGAPHRMKLALPGTSSVFESPWLWIAIGVVAAAGTAAVVVGTRNEEPPCGCFAMDPTICPDSC